MTEPTHEQALLARIRAGDKAACAECIEEHSPEIYRLALRLMRNEAEAEEVVQDTFLNAFKGIDQFDGRAGLRTWLYRIAYNTALMRHRRVEPELVPVDEVGDPEEGALVPQALFDWCCLPGTFGRPFRLSGWQDLGRTVRRNRAAPPRPRSDLRFVGVYNA